MRKEGKEYKGMTLTHTRILEYATTLLHVYMNKTNIL